MEPVLRNIIFAMNMVEAGMIVGSFSRTPGCDILNLPTAWGKLGAFRPDDIVNCTALVGSVNYGTDFAADVNMQFILDTHKITQQMREVIVVNPIANCAYPGVIHSGDTIMFTAMGAGWTWGTSIIRWGGRKGD